MAAGGWYIEGLFYAVAYAFISWALYHGDHHFLAGMFLGLVVGVCGTMLRERFVHGRK